MTDHTAVETELREQLQRVVEIVRPYANSHGHFHNALDVRTAVELAGIALERARKLAERLR
jgi:hypothetical protein